MKYKINELNDDLQFVIKNLKFLCKEYDKSIPVTAIKTQIKHLKSVLKNLSNLDKIEKSK